MDDTLAVRGVDGIGDLPREQQRVIEIDEARRRLALDVLHHQIVRPDIVEGADVRMVQAAIACASRSKRSLKGARSS